MPNLIKSAIKVNNPAINPKYPIKPAISSNFSAKGV